MKKDDPEILKLYGLTAEEAQDPGRALLSGGVRKMFDVLRYMKLPYDLGEDGMQRAPDYGKRPPAWQSLTGLFPDQIEEMPPEKREEKAQNLVDIVLHLLRSEINLDKEKPNPYHTVQWDPLPKICAQLGISRAELSRQSKFATGLAAHELVDIVRVKNVKEKMKAQVREFMAVLVPQASSLPPDVPQASSLRVEETPAAHAGKMPAVQFTAAAVWKMLREARKGPHFHRGQWALTLGFPNHARFYRACMVFFQLAPQQLELIAIEEVFEETKQAQPSGCGGEDAATTAGGTPALRTPAQQTDERLSQIVWNQMKSRHVQFFAELSEKLWSEAS